MGFLSRLVGYSFGDRVRNFWLKLRVKPLRWLGHILYLSSVLDAPRRLSWEVFQVCPIGRKPRGRPRTS